MPLDLTSALVLVVTCALTFLVARIVSRKSREKRRQKDDAQRRAGESRQVRRARERRGK